MLKPPGGGSSDIFGVGGGEAQQSPRKVKQYMASNISLTDGAAPTPSGPGSTSSAASTASSGETPSPGSPITGSPTRNGTAPQEAQEAQQAQAGQGVEAVAAAGKAPDGEPRGRQFQMESHFSLGYDKPATPAKAEGEAEPAARGTYPPRADTARSGPLRDRRGRRGAEPAGPA